MRCTALCFLLLWAVTAPSNIFRLNKVGVGVLGVCCTKGRRLLFALPPSYFFVSKCLLQPLPHLQNRSMLLPLHRCRRQKLVWLLAPRDAAFGRCCWMSVSAHPGGCTELCQASVVLNAGSKHRSSIAWNRELCKSNLGGCGRLAFFLDYSKSRVLLAFPCFCLQTREEAAGERQTAPAENRNGKLALANASCLHF